MNITVIGGGNSAHVLIPLLSKKGHNVSILTRRPQDWSDKIHLEYVLANGEIKRETDGKLEFASSNPEEVIPNSDIIVLCMPVNKYRETLDRVAPYINKDKKVFVGTIYGQAGFNWMVDSIIKKFQLKKLNYFAIGLIPWICRTKEYGKSGITYGCKTNNLVAVYPRSEFNYLNENFLRHVCFDWFNKGEFVLSDNFISLTLSVDNQIIHPSRLYALANEEGGIWDKETEIPFFYKDYTSYSAEVLQNLDDEYTKIRENIKKQYDEKNFMYMNGYMESEHFSYNSNSHDIVDSFVNSQTLSSIKTPVVEKNNKYVINRNHRFFYDDIYYGLCIAKWFAQELHIDVPTVDKIIMWAEKELKDKILINKKMCCNIDDNKYKYGVPTVYGINSVTEAID